MGGLPIYSTGPGFASRNSWCRTNRLIRKRLHWNATEHILLRTYAVEVGFPHANKPGTTENVRRLFEKTRLLGVQTDFPPKVCHWNGRPVTLADKVISSPAAFLFEFESRHHQRPFVRSSSMPRIGNIIYYRGRNLKECATA